MRIRLDLDTETTERLAQEAVRQRRPIIMQAEVLLREALGVPLDSAKPTQCPFQSKEAKGARNAAK